MIVIMIIIIYNTYEIIILCDSPPFLSHTHDALQKYVAIRAMIYTIVIIIKANDATLAIDLNIGSIYYDYYYITFFATIIKYKKERKKTMELKKTVTGLAFASR